MEYWVVWLIIVVLLGIIEVSTVNLVSIWFIASGIVSLFVSLITDSFLLQFGIFVVLGIILMLMTRSTLVKKLSQNKEKMNLERIIGMNGIVTEEIKKNAVGEVKVDGKLWSAIAEKRIKKDEEVKVLSIDGVKLVVEKIVQEQEPKEEKTPKKTATKKTSSTTKKSSGPKKATSAKKKSKNSKKVSE